MIFSSIASGLPCSSSCARWMFFSSAITFAGASSRRSHLGLLQAICMATSFTSAWNFSLRAVKSVSQLTSTRTPILRVLLGLLRLAGMVRLVPRLPLDRGVRDLAAEQPDGADGVVVAGDHVVDALGVAVGVDQGHDGDAQAGRLVDGDVLLLRVDDEEAAGKPRHLLDAAQVLLQ